MDDLLPVITVAKALAMQVCVPESYTEDQIISFAERSNPAGTEYGWHIARKGDTALVGCEERVQCAERKNCVHVVLVV